VSRHIRVKELTSGLDARVVLLEEAAPASAEVLWKLCETGGSYYAIHAMWTGPEISCPIDIAKHGGAPIDIGRLPLENATSFPVAGDVVLVSAPRGLWRGAPAVDIVDVGFFYGDGGRLLLPMGWIMGSVCARVLPEDLQAYQEACRRIRATGECQLVFSREETP